MAAVQHFFRSGGERPRTEDAGVLVTGGAGFIGSTLATTLVVENAGYRTGADGSKFRAATGWKPDISFVDRAERVCDPSPSG